VKEQIDILIFSSMAHPQTHPWHSVSPSPGVPRLRLFASLHRTILTARVHHQKKKGTSVRSKNKRVNNGTPESDYPRTHTSTQR
jgi:hypothetical protein